MADPLSPDEVAHRTFRQRVRGYDPQEVQAFLDEVAVSMRDLATRSEALHTRLLELGNRDLTAEFDRVSDDVGRILQDARQASEGMRSRAAGDAEELVEDAQTAAVELRSDAWMAAEKLLLDSTKEATAIVQAGERDSLAIIGEGEREAHRRQTAARRESEESIRAAKVEAERVLMDARARSDELIGEAQRKVRAAETRAQTVEERRTEMLAELENARQTIGNLEDEIEKRREALAGPSPAEVESSTVKLLAKPEPESAGDSEPTAWADGDEVVKIVRPPKRIVEPLPEPVDAEAMAAEVARLRTPSERAAIESTGSEPEVEVLPVPVEVESEPPAEVETRSPVDSPLPANEIDDLFARLRQTQQTTPPESTGTTDEAGEDAGRVAEPEPAPPPVPSVPGTARAFDLRDRVLLPVTNRALRTVKRELTEAQNIALEELRAATEDWRPDPAVLAERLTEPIGDLLADAYSAGWTAAGEATGTTQEITGDGQGDPVEWSGRLSGDLTKAVAERLAESRSEGRGPRQIAAGLSRVYRTWRTDEAERRVRDMAAGAYHRGLVGGLDAAGWPAVRWVVAGRGCTTCREAAEIGAVPPGSIFDDELAEPPAHPDCGCTLVPA